jgi:dephospho-CoA kinase
VEGYDALMSVPRFIGLTGPNASGKGEAAEHLERAHGYAPCSLSDVLRKEARRRGQEPVRGVLIPLGTELRETHGPGALAELILPDLVAPALIDSIRNPVEVQVLRRLGGFVMLRLDAPMELRFQRARARRRPGDPQTLADFEAREAEENTSNPAAQQLDATGALADHAVLNDQGLEKLHARLDALLADLAAGPQDQA